MFTRKIIKFYDFNNLTAPSVKKGLLAAMDSWGREVTPKELVDF